MGLNLGVNQAVARVGEVRHLIERPKSRRLREFHHRAVAHRKTVRHGGHTCVHWAIDGAASVIGTEPEQTANLVRQLAFRVLSERHRNGYRA